GPGCQKRIDQLWQILAVAAFEDYSRRSIDLAQKFSQRSEILALERHLYQWIAAGGVEACRDKEQIGFKPQQFFQRPLRHLDIMIPRRPGAEWIIRDIHKRFCARSRVTGELMDGCNGDLRIVRNNCLGAIAVMSIEIPNRDTVCGVV